MDSTDKALHSLLTQFGHSKFRDGQAEVIQAVLAGRDLLVVMPTGGGKSLCYQLPATMLPGVTLIVSPLIALMKDQVDSLNREGIPASYINSTLSPHEVGRRTSALGRDGVKLVYVAPERFRNPRFVEAISQVKVSLLAVDEAHCISHWGHDFRPEYLKLSDAANMLGNPPVIALTATATEKVRRDILLQLRLRNPAVFVTGFDRPNLRLRVLQTGGDKDKLSILKTLLTELPGKGIVYAATRRSVEQITSRFKVAGFSAEAYHAGLPEAVRTEVQERFQNGEIKAIVATNAFGMGVDTKDIRFVIHYHLPGSMEAYYQEIGRAGRDGEPADCILLFNYADTRFQQLLIDASHPSPDLILRTLDLIIKSPPGTETLSSREIARSLGLTREGSVRSALNVLEKAGQIGWVDGPSFSATAVLAVPSDVALVTFPDSTKEGILLRHLIFERDIAREEIEFDEDDIARRLGLAPLTVRDCLSRLSSLGMIHRQSAGCGASPKLLDNREIGRLETELAALSERLSAEQLKLRRVVEYCHHRRCLRAFVLRYFGDDKTVSPCGECSSCKPEEARHTPVSGRKQESAAGMLLIKAPAGVTISKSDLIASAKQGGPGGPGPLRSVTADAVDGSASRKAPRSRVRGSSEDGMPAENPRSLTDRESHIVKKVLECVSRLNGRFGKGTVSAVLAGSDSLEIRTHRLNNSPGYGALSGFSVAEINSVIKCLIEANCIAVSRAGYPTIGLTDLGREVIHGQEVQLHI